MRLSRTPVLVAFLALAAAAGCSSASSDSSSSSGGGGGGGGSGTTPPAITQAGPAAGNPDGKDTVPAEAQAEDVSKPTTVVGTGTAASCTGDAFVAAVTTGGVITFDCGADPVTITLTQTATRSRSAAAGRSASST